MFNAVFFTYGLVLTTFQDVPDRGTGPTFCLWQRATFADQLLLGPFFDIISRRIRIAGTYAIGGLILLATSVMFGLGTLSAWTQTLVWMLIFFFASAAASSAYLTASEIFLLEMRGLAIAVDGYALVAALLLVAAALGAKYGIDAEGRSLEQIADPLSAA